MDVAAACGSGVASSMDLVQFGGGDADLASSFNTNSIITRN